MAGLSSRLASISDHDIKIVFEYFDIKIRVFSKSLKTFFLLHFVVDDKLSKPCVVVS